MNKIIPYKPYLIPLAKKLRERMTYAEILLWNELQKKQIQGCKFSRQRPIDVYIVDFYCKELQLAIELDGYTHDSELAIENDIKRQKNLEKLGVRFLRFDNLEVKTNIENVLLTIEGWIIDNKK